MATSPTKGVFDPLYQEGVRLFNAGELPAAAKVFSSAFNVAENDQQYADATHQLALVLTKQRELRQAKKEFEWADWYAERADNDAQRYRIKRDLAWLEMVRLQRNPLYFLISIFPASKHGFGPLDRAEILLQNSLNGLNHLKEKQEALITRAYFGRLDVLRRDYHGAFATLHYAYETLLKQSPININWTYRLNLLMWLIRAAPKPERADWQEVIEALIQKTGQTSRLVELKVILKFGDTGYRIVQWFPEWLQKIGYKLVKPLLGK